MGFLGEEYEEQENSQVNEDIQEIEDNPNAPNAEENGKKQLCESLKKIAGNLLSIAKKMETENMMKNEIQSRMEHEMANLSKAMDMMKSQFSIGQNSIFRLFIYENIKDNISLML